MNKKEIVKKSNMAYIQLQELLSVGLVLLVLTVGLAVGLQVLGEVRDDMTGNTSEYNATQDGIEGLAKIPAKLPLIATVVVAAVIIGLIVRFLAARFG